MAQGIGNYHLVRKLAAQWDKLNKEAKSVTAVGLGKIAPPQKKPTVTFCDRLT